MGSKGEELVDIALSFWEVAIHTVLHGRRVYPAAVFERRREYGVAVYMSRHPDVNDAIHDALFHARPLLLRGAVEAAVLVLLDASGAAVEQYTFRADTRVAPEVPATYSDVETMMASALLRLGALAPLLPPLPPDATFTLLLHTHEPLVGPNDKADYAAAAAAAGGGGSGGGAPAWLPGALGVDSSSGVAASAGSGASGAGVGADGPYWIRTDGDDPEATLARAAAEGSGIAMRPIKTVRAGPLALDVELHRWAAPPA